jgi:hypothetical protein
MPSRATPPAKTVIALRLWIDSIGIFLHRELELSFEELGLES